MVAVEPATEPGRRVEALDPGLLLRAPDWVQGVGPYNPILWNETHRSVSLSLSPSLSLPRPFLFVYFRGCHGLLFIGMGDTSKKSFPTCTACILQCQRSQLLLALVESPQDIGFERRLLGRGGFLVEEARIGTGNRRIEELRPRTTIGLEVLLDP